MNNVELVRAVGGLDWDFISSRKGYLAPLHWYPGTFVRPLSAAIIQACTDIGDRVLDPYCGIGTTAVSASTLHRVSSIADINPVAALTAFASTALVSLAATQKEQAYAALQLCEALNRASSKSPHQFIPGLDTLTPWSDEWCSHVVRPSASVFWDACAESRTPNTEGLSDWFSRRGLEEVLTLYERFMDVERVDLPRILAFVMISSALRTASSQNASWGHIADNVRPKEYKTKIFSSITSRWIKSARKTVEWAASFRRQNDVGAHELFVGDSQNFSPTGQSRLLLTSPPYAGAIDYVLSQRLSLYLLGYSEQKIMQLVAAETGARRKRFKANSEQDWSEQVAKVLE